VLLTKTLEQFSLFERPQEKAKTFGTRARQNGANFPVRRELREELSHEVLPVGHLQQREHQCGVRLVGLVDRRNAHRKAVQLSIALTKCQPSFRQRFDDTDLKKPRTIDVCQKSEMILTQNLLLVLFHNTDDRLINLNS
jgi:hypothetical protein